MACSYLLSYLSFAIPHCSPDYYLDHSSMPRRWTFPLLICLYAFAYLNTTKYNVSRSILSSEMPFCIRIPLLYLIVLLSLFLGFLQCSWFTSARFNIARVDVALVSFAPSVVSAAIMPCYAKAFYIACSSCSSWHLGCPVSLFHASSFVWRCVLPSCNFLCGPTVVDCSLTSSCFCLCPILSSFDWSSYPHLFLTLTLGIFLLLSDILFFSALFISGVAWYRYLYSVISPSLLIAFLDRRYYHILPYSISLFFVLYVNF